MLRDKNFKREIKRKYGHVIKFIKRYNTFKYRIDNLKKEYIFVYCFYCKNCNCAIELEWLKTSSKKCKNRRESYWIENDFISCNEMIIKSLLE